MPTLKDPLTLGKLLAHACSNPVDDWWNEYVIDLHCVRFNIIARPLGNEQYEIDSWTIEDN